MQYSKRLITILYHALLILVPLVFYTKTSELFEFNKIIVVYTLTSLILSFWLVRMVLTQKIIFKRTSLDIPILIFLTSMFLSSIISISPRTSFLGYYSRFHGGFSSYLAYSFLYWAFVSNVNKDEVKFFLYNLLLVTTFVSIYTFLEHFGTSPSCLFVTGNFDVACWVQDVKFRPYATFGQPNWLAAWLAAVIPLTWTIHSRRRILSPLLSAFFFSALLFTKSRSGILGLISAFIVFWTLALWRPKVDRTFSIKPFILTTVALLLVTFLIGTFWTPNILEVYKNRYSPREASSEVGLVTTVLETGGTASGEIRKIVWRGAFDLWKKYPVLGTGLETFANSYYETRPREHNLVSEWNFLYNKAHNEYLNFLATTGIVGTTAYFILLVFILSSLYKNKEIGVALLAGFASILVTNFFGFSVVPIGVIMFMFPAFALANNPKVVDHPKLKNTTQFVFLSVIALATLATLFTIYRYWKADTYYAKGSSLLSSGSPDKAVPFLTKAVKISPAEALFRVVLADAYAEEVLNSVNKKNMSLKEVEPLTEKALKESELAENLAPYDIKVLKTRINVFTSLASTDGQFIDPLITLIENLKKLAPTDASIFYKEALIYIGIGNEEKAVSLLNDAITLKPNYEKAKQVLMIIKEKENAKN